MSSEETTPGKNVARPVLYRRENGAEGRRNVADDESFIALRDDGIHAFRQGDYARAAGLLERAFAQKPAGFDIRRALAETQLRLGRVDEAFALASESLERREDARLRRTRVSAARRLVRRALDARDGAQIRALIHAVGDDLSGGVNGAPLRYLVGALNRDRADIRSGLAQLIARARFETTKAAGDADKSDRLADEAARIAAIRKTVALDARAVFEIDGAAGVFLADVAIAAAPDAAVLRAERLCFSLARGEIDNPNQMLDYALDPRAYGADIAELNRLYRLTLRHRATSATTRALRALRMRQLEALASGAAAVAEIEAAGQVALDFGDFGVARDVLDILNARAEAARTPTPWAATHQGSSAQGPIAQPTTPSAAEAARRFGDAFSIASLAAGELMPDFMTAAETFWREILDAREPLDAFFETLADDTIAIIAPTGLLTAPHGGARREETASGTLNAPLRQTLFAGARVFARRGLAHRLRLFPWSMRELERSPRGKPIYAPNARRGPRANLFIAHGPGPTPHTAYIDRFGVDGWSEIAQNLPFAEARSSEIFAYFETTRASVFGARTPPLRRPPQEAVAVLLQSPQDPRLALANATLKDMLDEAAAWVERRQRRLVIWRPAACRDIGVDETVERLTRSDRIDCAPAPMGLGDLGRAASEVAGVVTINAPAAFEALLALRPVILCGVADFHHGARLLENANEIPDALDRIDAPLDPTAVARFVYDYLGGPMANLLSAQDLEEKLTNALVATGLLNPQG